MTEFMYDNAQNVIIIYVTIIVLEYTCNHWAEKLTAIG